MRRLRLVSACYLPDRQQWRDDHDFNTARIIPSRFPHTFVFKNMTGLTLLRSPPFFMNWLIACWRDQPETFSKKPAMRVLVINTRNSFSSHPFVRTCSQQDHLSGGGKKYPVVEPEQVPGHFTTTPSSNVDRRRPLDWYELVWLVLGQGLRKEWVARQFPLIDSDNEKVSIEIQITLWWYIWLIDTWHGGPSDNL